MGTRKRGPNGGRMAVALWCVCNGNAAVIGRPLTGHRSRAAADRAARKVSGTVEPAEVIALVQGGASAVDAYQQMARCGREYQPALVELAS
jgi:nicotinic acid phosphoribosyltransferase